MLVIGLLLVLLVVAVGLAVLFSGTASTSMEIFNITLSTQVRGWFFAGALAVLILVAGLVLVGAGLKRSRSRRKEVKSLRNEVKAKHETPTAAEKPTKHPTATTKTDRADEHFESTPKDEPRA